jgi:[acyl-carrier-protein] S-malonyltransferase
MSARPEIGACAFAFPGVGVGLCGAEAAFAERHRATLGPFLGEASSMAAADLGARLVAGSTPEPGGLDAQLLAYAFGCGVAAVVRDHGIEPRLTAGYSLGLYAALHAAGAIGFGDGLAIVRRADEIMRAHCPASEHDLAVVLGLGREDLAALLARPALAAVRVAIANSDQAAILAGPEAVLEAASALALEAGALKATLLGVGLPYHHPELLGPASRELEAFLRGIEWHAPRCPVVSTIDHGLVVDPAGLRDLTARNIASPIDWQRTLEELRARGIELVIECGAGVSLSQNARLVAGSPRFVNLRTFEKRLGI